MTTSTDQLDTSELEQRVKGMYQEVALEPEREFHFETGRPFAAAASALRSGGRLALSDIVTAEQLPGGVTCDASLWAACIGGAMQRDGYREAIEAAGFEIETWRENPEYRFVSDQADNATQKYGVTSISLFARRR